MLTPPGTRSVGLPAAAPTSEGDPAPARRRPAPRPGERRAAPLRRRLLATALDAGLLVLAAAPLAAGLLWMLRLQGGWPAQLLIGFGTSLLCAAALLLAWCQGVRGRAPGAAALGLRLVRGSDEAALGTGPAVLRTALTLPLLPVTAVNVLRQGPGRPAHDRLFGSRLLDVRRGEDPWHPRPVLAAPPDPGTVLGAAATPVIVPQLRAGGLSCLTPRPRPVESAP